MVTSLFKRPTNKWCYFLDVLLKQKQMRIKVMGKNCLKVWMFSGYTTGSRIVLKHVGIWRSTKKIIHYYDLQNELNKLLMINYFHPNISFHSDLVLISFVCYLSYNDANFQIW